MSNTINPGESITDALRDNQVVHLSGGTYKLSSTINLDAEKELIGARPEWVRCIADTHADNKGKTWCGRQVDQFEWVFLDVDHAAMNGRNDGRLLACPECSAAVSAALLPESRQAASGELPEARGSDET